MLQIDLANVTPSSARIAIEGLNETKTYDEIYVVLNSTDKLIVVDKSVEIKDITSPCIQVKAYVSADGIVQESETVTINLPLENNPPKSARPASGAIIW